MPAFDSGSPNFPFRYGDGRFISGKHCPALFPRQAFFFRSDIAYIGDVAIYHRKALIIKHNAAIIRRSPTGGKFTGEHTPSRGGSGVTSLALAGMDVAVKMTRNRPVRNDLWKETAKDGRWGVSSIFFTACC